MSNQDVTLAPPQSKFPNFLYQNFGLFLDLIADFWDPIIFPKNQISCGGASLIQAWFKLAPPLYKNSNKWKINYTKILGFFLGSGNHVKPIFQNHPISKKTTLFLKNKPLRNWRVPEFWAFFGLFKNVHIDFWASTLNTNSHPCMAIQWRLSPKIIFLQTLLPRKALWFLGSSKMSQ